MGKNKKTKGGQQQQKSKQQPSKHQHHDACCGSDNEHDDHHTHEQEIINQEPQLTPEEKAKQYKDMQLSNYKNIVESFKDEEKSLMEEPNFTDKQKEFDKREKEDLKKLEKIFKKDQNEVDELYHNTNANNQVQLKQFRDRIAKTIAEIVKQQKQLQKIQGSHNDSDKIVAKVKNDIQSAINKKQMLSNLCMALLDKNHDLYLKHEKMLDEEKQERQRLAVNFQDQMKEVTQELETQKEQRSAEIQENYAIREKIQKAINDYKKKEEQYRNKMQDHGKVIQDIESKLKNVIEGSITTAVKQAHAEKEKFLKAMENCKELSEKINGYMAKFDKIKDDMNENGKKFENYQMTIETKKTEIRVLEAEIENVVLSEKRFQKVDAEIKDERKKHMQQIEALRNLKGALTLQLKNLEDSNKENSVAN